jgi:hypothetical protein
MSNPKDTGATGRRRGAEVIDELENLEITVVLGEEYDTDYEGADEDSGDGLVEDVESWLERNG